MRVAIALSSSKSAVLINTEIGLWTRDGICDSVTLVLQLFNYWKHSTVSLPTAYAVGLHTAQASAGLLTEAEGLCKAALQDLCSCLAEVI